MNKKELQKYFEEKYLKGTCFDGSLKELLKDETNWQVNIVRCLIAVELKGVWRGLQELLSVKNYIPIGSDPKPM